MTASIPPSFPNNLNTDSEAEVARESGQLFSKKALIRAFNRAAASYDDSSVLAQEVGNRLLDCLDLMRIQPQNILDLGAGTGYLNGLLAKRYPVTRIVALDFSHQMLQQNRQAQGQAICADAEKLPFSESCFDLVISNLMLPWCMDLGRIFAEVRSVLKPGGLFLFSSLGRDTLHELYASWAAVDDMPHVHPGYDLHEMGDVLLEAAFADPVLDKENITVFYESVLSLLGDLKACGAQNLLELRRRSLTGKDRWQRFLQGYEGYRNGEGYVPASFEVVYGHAWARGKKLGSGEVRIPVQNIVKNF